MPGPLPPEILDLIVDHLHDEPTTLNACCLASKSWVPRARRHIFALVDFKSATCLGLWMKAFPVPSNSPAHYARNLNLFNIGTARAATTGAHPWVQSFNRVVVLRVATLETDDRHISFTRLHGLSPTLKSLHLLSPSIPTTKALNFIYSFPLLEDLTLRSVSPPSDTDGWNAPPTSPKFTGLLFLTGGNRHITRRLLDLQGLHFSKIKVFCPTGDDDLVKELVLLCSNTLESLFVELYPITHALEISPSLDLSKATKLKDVKFVWHKLNVQWITATLRTIKSENLQQITIHFPTIRNPIDEATRREWQDLDHLLVRLWTTYSTRLAFTYKKMERGDADEPVTMLLPGLMSRGAVYAV